MKKNLLLRLACIIFIFIMLSNVFISYDSHMVMCNNENCERCLLIYNAKKILENIFLINCIGISLVSMLQIYKVRAIFKEIIYMNLVMMKVRLNE
jgi:hypothetical protein